MGSDESHFNASLIVRGIVTIKTVSINNKYEERGQPERNRTEVLPLTSLTAGPNRLTLGSPSLIVFIVSADVKRC